MTTFEKAPKLKSENVRIGLNFLGILNDLKRRPEDASRELDVPLEEIQSIIEGKKELSRDLVAKAAKVWPVNERDFYLMTDDCPNGVIIMTEFDSKKTGRIMERAGKPYYEYRDTAMSSVAPFRPEWISELCYVEDNSPDNVQVQWNNGHFMHQFTYFIGDVNFYYRDENGEKKVAIMNTGDSMYITPFVPHTFSTRKGATKDGLILALTYGNKLTGDTQNELSVLQNNLGSQFVLDFSTKEKSGASLIQFHRESTSMGLEELHNQTQIVLDVLEKIESGQHVPSYEEYEKIARALHVNIRDLLPNDSIENKVIVHMHNNARTWSYPDATKAYTIVELATTNYLPHSKALEFTVNGAQDRSLDLKVGLHQYGYNVGDTDIEMNWEFDSKVFHKSVKPGDTFYIKPFIPHNFRNKGKLLILRVAGKVTGEPQRELSFVGKENVTRAISETIQWFDPAGNN